MIVSEAARVGYLPHARLGVKHFRPRQFFRLHRPLYPSFAAPMMTNRTDQQRSRLDLGG